MKAYYTINTSCTLKLSSLEHDEFGQQINKSMLNGQPAKISKATKQSKRKTNEQTIEEEENEEEEEEEEEDRTSFSKSK